MLQHEFTRKMILLVVLLCIVLGIFFVQQNALLSKSSSTQPTPTPVAAHSGNISIAIPHGGTNVSTEFVVAGKANVPGDVVSLRVVSSILGKTYYRGQAVARDKDAQGFGTYNTRVRLNTDDFSLRPNDKLTLEVYYYSLTKKTELDSVSLPIIFSPELP